jgi:hypothetical protein
MTSVIHLAVQAVVGIGLIGYALVLIAQRVRAFVPGPAAAERAPVDDLRLVIDLAARLRDKGKSDAVVVCQKLLDELLKPGGQS